MYARPTDIFIPQFCFPSKAILCFYACFDAPPTAASGSLSMEYLCCAKNMMGTPGILRIRRLQTRDPKETPKPFAGCRQGFHFYFILQKEKAWRGEDKRRLINRLRRFPYKVNLRPHLRSVSHVATM
jgi:hypothetical protein